MAITDNEMEDVAHDNRMDEDAGVQVADELLFNEAISYRGHRHTHQCCYSMCFKDGVHFYIGYFALVDVDFGIELDLVEGW